MKIKIMLVDDHQVMRQGLRSLLEKNSAYDVVGEAENGRAAIELCRRLMPDIIIMDIGMPDLNGIEATRLIKAIDQKVKVLALSMHSDKRFVLEVLKAGASAYLLKDCAFEDLGLAIRSAMEDRLYLSPPLTDIILKDYVAGLIPQERSVFNVLTVREREVLQLLAEGNNAKGIAYRLKVSLKTIETHRSHIMEKLGLKSMAELTKYAVREGLTSLEP